MFGLGKSSSAAHKAPLTGDLGDEKLRFEVIVNAIEDGVILVDSQQVIQLINPGASTICGWPAQDANGISVLSVMKLANDKGEPLADNENPFVQIFKQQEAVKAGNVTLINKDNQQVCISLTISPLLDENKQVTAAVAVFRDVSEERAEEKKRGDFISTASHEMRTPVAAIEGYLALALNEKVSTIDARARD